MKKHTHGGKRKGSGRKKKEPTTTVRVPLALLPRIMELVDAYKVNKDLHSSNVEKGTLGGT